MAKGYLHVITSPVKGDIFINAEYRGTGDTNIGLEQGTYTVSFGPVSGYTAPSQMSVTVNPGFTALVTVDYVKAMGMENSMSVPPSPELQRKFNNTDQLVRTGRSDLIPGLSARRPQDYVDLPTYESIKKAMQFRRTVN